VRGQRIETRDNSHVGAEAIERTLRVPSKHSDSVTVSAQTPDEMATHEAGRPGKEYMALSLSRSDRNRYAHPLRRPPVVKHREGIADRPRKHPNTEHSEQPRVEPVVDRDHCG